MVFITTAERQLEDSPSNLEPGSLAKSEALRLGSISRPAIARDSPSSCFLSAQIIEKNYCCS